MALVLVHGVTEGVEVLHLLRSVGNTQVKVPCWVGVHPFALDLLKSHFNILILERVDNSRLAGLLSDDNMRHGVIHHLVVDSRHPSFSASRVAVSQPFLKLCTVCGNEGVHLFLPGIEHLNIVLDGLVSV